ncbi:MAG: electron transport complex subunit RsxB [Polaromonas sp.]
MNASSLSRLAHRIHAALPQTQCKRCAYDDCLAYARAVALGEADINQCPPGGAEGIARLASITGRPVLPLNPVHGTEGARTVAFIDEDWCIGCTLCIKACPVDAIFGSNKKMHTVLEDHCTGCELCVPACPVDCINLETVTGARTGWNAWSQEQADAARTRYELHSAKRPLDKGSKGSGDETPETIDMAESPRPTVPAETGPASSAAEHKRALITAALAKAREQRAAKKPNSA